MEAGCEAVLMHCLTAARLNGLQDIVMDGAQTRMGLHCI